ncbi:MAG: hypothetical protein HOM25_07330 [Rhodospirillaceae bacterium]|jgi:hypothetical protein|nr:hypothetical protein [Rhodospirillaceae bacterium]MBT5665222.1 hypothetical protein [Rhodospirillaceae bacterium]MBT5811560.1 hypothetical protein [Rhodospirillaceae bacterium]
MMDLLKRVLLTGVALALLIVAERAFGIVAAFVLAGVGFVAYIAYVSLRETAADSDTESEEDS